MLVTLGVHKHLVEGGEDALQLRAVKEVLEVGHDAVQQQVWLGYHHPLTSSNGVGCSQAVPLMLHQVSHCRYHLIQANLQGHNEFQVVLCL